MPAKNLAVKKPAAKTLPAKTVQPAAKKPAAKNAARPVAHKNTKQPAKPAAKVTAKPAIKKPVAKAALKPAPAKTTPQKPAVKAAPAKTPQKTAPAKSAANKPTPAKNTAKPVVKPAPAKTQPAAAKPVAKSAAKTAPASKNAAPKTMSVEDAVARVMNVVGKNDNGAAKVAAPKKAANDGAVPPVATAAAPAKTAKAGTAQNVAKPAKNDNVFDYKAGDMVVYPAHGVGQVDGVETLTIGGIEVTLYTITFAKDRMRLKLPLQKIKTSGLRPLSTKEQMQSALQTMRGRARIKRVMWSRRAQEYEAKINSGSPVQVAEVLRDLRRNATGAENSYSERQIFQSALERLASELAAIEKIGEADAAIKLQNVLTEAA